MDYESACSALQTVCAARLFYEHRKLNRLLECGVKQSAGDLREIYFDLLYAGCDYISIDYNENFECSHWYFSFYSMMQYYRLIREYGSLHSMKLSENPYIRKAEEMLSDTFYPCSQGGGMGWSYQKKIGSEWSSGIIIETDAYFNSEYELLEALLTIDEWYKAEVLELEEVLEKERVLVTGAVPEMEAA